MKLHLIREKAAESEITLRELCARIGMTYQNLHRCISDNKITANALEQISKVLNVPVYIFFDNYDEDSCGDKLKEKLNTEKETISYDLDRIKLEVGFLKREIEMKDKIIGLLEAR